MNRKDWITLQLAKALPRLKEAKHILVYPFGEMGKLTKAILQDTFDLPCVVFDKHALSTTGGHSSEDLTSWDFSQDVLIFTVYERYLFDDVLDWLLVHTKVDFTRMLLLFGEQNIMSWRLCKYLLHHGPRGKVLDVGSGYGFHARAFHDFGYDVTAITSGNEIQNDGHSIKGTLLRTTFEEYDFHETYDLLWMSHILEHVDNPNAFLRKALHLVKPGGTMTVAVPDKERNVVFYHVHTFTIGHILRQMIFAGIDCRSAKTLRDGYGDCILVENVHPIDDIDRIRREEQIEEAWKYLPDYVRLLPGWKEQPYFDGDVGTQGWDEDI